MLASEGKWMRRRKRALTLKRAEPLDPVAAADALVAARDDAREKARLVEREPRAYVRRQWVIDLYHQRGAITREQHSAATTLREDWARSGLDPWATTHDAVIYGGARAMPGSGPGYADYTAAMRAVGIILSPMLASVVLHGWSAESAYPGRREDALAVLRLALDTLDAHYRGERKRALDILPRRELRNL